MIPPFDDAGLLPPGVHSAEWEEFCQRFGVTPYRKVLITGMERALDALRIAHCKAAYIDGSFVTATVLPGDFDACWSTDGVMPELLDSVLLDFSNRRAAQKAKFYGELFPVDFRNGVGGLTFFEFFQMDKETGGPKGIVSLDLRRLP